MRRLGLACALLATLAACGRAPTPIEPTAAPTRSANKPATPSASSTLAPPKLPAIANRNDATGAANFVVYWVKVSNYAALTGDTDLLRRISDPNCEGCNRYIDLYEKTYARGGSFEAGNRKLEDIVTQFDKSDAYVSGNLVAEPGFFRTTRSAKRQPAPAQSTKVTFLARFNGNRWAMRDVGLTGR